MAQLEVRRREISEALARVTELEFWNGGGSGSVEATAADAAVTEIAAGSGLLVPGIFDHYASFEPRPAAFFGLRVTRKPTPAMATVHGGGLIASGADRRGPLPHPLGAARAAPHRARGRRRGPDAADRPPGRAAGHRRPRVVPPRQVGRAVRARPRRAPGPRRVGHRGGAVLPRLRPCLLTRARSPERSPTACLPRPRRWARVAWSASTAPPGRGRRRWPRGSRTSYPVRRWCTATSSSRAGAGCPGLAATVADLLAPLASGRIGQWTRWDWLADDWAETHDGRRRAACSCSRVWAAGRPTSPTWSACWCGSRPGPSSASTAGIARDGEQMRAHWQQWRRRRGRAARAASAPATTPTSWSPRTEALLRQALLVGRYSSRW